MNSKERVRYLIVCVAVLLGAAAGIFRGIELITGFEFDTGLEISGAVSITLTRIFTLLSALVLAVISKIFSPERTDYYTQFAEHEKKKHAGWIIGIAGGFTFILSGVFDAMMQTKFAILNGIFIVFAIFTGVAWILSLISKNGNTQSGIFALVRVFFSCFWLIIVYRSMTVNSSSESYIYELLAISSFIISGFYIAGYCFENVNPGRSFYFAVLSILLNLEVFIGRIVPLLNRGVLLNPEGLGYYFAAVIVSLGCAFSMARQVEKDNADGSE